MNNRHKEILSILSTGQQASVNELSDRLSVSPATIRQDLTTLENKGFLRRVHGGAVIDESEDIAHRMAINYDKKLQIARAARDFVQPGETIFIESGSINALFAKEVCKIDKVTIITNNAFIARHVGDTGSGNIILLGGIYQAASECIVGNLARHCLGSLNFSKAFIGVDGFTPTTGFTGRDMMRAELNSEIIQRSNEVFILSDSTKFGKIALSRYCGAEDIDVLITDSELPAEYRELFTANNINVILADAKTLGIA